jgi:hypothetical protein
MRKGTSGFSMGIDSLAAQECAEKMKSFKKLMIKCSKSSDDVKQPRSMSLPSLAETKWF